LNLDIGGMSGKLHEIFGSIKLCIGPTLHGPKVESGIEFWPEKTRSGRPDKNEARKNDSNVGPTRKPQP